jgi:hypothetical protein
VISGTPRGSQLAAASRTEQPHLPRLRASGKAAEFGSADLAVNAAGARQIFASAKVSLTPEHAAVVTERTEGWPVGLHLAALIIKDSRGQERAVTGDDRYVADYLYREALIRQPEAMKRLGVAGPGERPWPVWCAEGVAAAAPRGHRRGPVHGGAADARAGHRGRQGQAEEAADHGARSGRAAAC